jgi:hypothetical protein
MASSTAMQRKGCGRARAPPLALPHSSASEGVDVSVQASLTILAMFGCPVRVATRWRWYCAGVAM